MTQTNSVSAAFMKIMKQYGGILLALIILCVVFSSYNQRFMSVANFMNILQQVAVIAIAAFGMTWVILLGEIDLSVGSIIAVAGMVGAQCFAFGFGFFPAVLLTLCAGAMMGMINGTLTANQFVKNTTGLAGDSDDHIIYETDTGWLYYDSNGSAAGGSTHFATLAANLALTTAHFVVI